jgi:cyclase
MLEPGGDRNTRVIPGHGPIATKVDLKASRDMLSLVQERLTPMVRQGRTVEEVVAAAPTKDLDQKWGATRGAGFVRQAYNSLLQQIGR